jgi:hypothetical protein
VPTTGTTHGPIYRRTRTKITARDGGTVHEAQQKNRQPDERKGHKDKTQPQPSTTKILQTSNQPDEHHLHKGGTTDSDLGLQHSTEKPLKKYWLNLIAETENAIKLLDQKQQNAY